jgi:hypothetical protein
MEEMRKEAVEAQIELLFQNLFETEKNHEKHYSAFGPRFEPETPRYEA